MDNPQDRSERFRAQAMKLNQVVARSWADDEFRKQLLADPVSVLRANGVEIPPNVRVEVHEESAQLSHLVIPVKPSDLQISDFGAADGPSWCWSFNAIGCF